MNNRRSKIAINIALIPSYSICEMAINLNKEISETKAEDYLLSRVNCIPHITLLMGVVKQGNLIDLQNQLQNIAEATHSLQLEIPGYYVGTLANKKYASSLVVKKTRALQQLHEEILKETSSLLHYDHVRAKMFYPDPPVNNFAQVWVKNFLKNNAKENYQPHITLGIGKVRDVPPLPINFRASQLALCHLGNYCTCPKILWEMELSVRKS